MVKKTQNMQETAFLTVEEDDAFTSLRAKLAEINKHPEVTGYIMRNDTSAIIDLKNPARLTEYAILTSQAVESAQQISELFNMGTTENILITGKDTQVLCIAIGENNAAIFMEKNADHNDILSRLQLASG
jgi:predicted regulator of Ras-like GTPase activity (Roadblock/LC7/MglB family)